MLSDKLRFLIDIGVGIKVEHWLKDNGYDMRSMRDIDPKAADVDILKIAVAESRMIVTMDKDFGELVYKSREPHTGVLILRLENATGGEKAEVVKTILHEHQDKLNERFCVFQAGRLRISK